MSSKKSSWDRERIDETWVEHIDDHWVDGREQFTQAMVELLGSVREEAIDWTWTHACNQRDRGMDHHKQPIPELLAMAAADLNPERDDG